MAEVSERLLRCAIYTRKSTEEGLEQSFNTLQGQPCYIKRRMSDEFSSGRLPPLQPRIHTDEPAAIVLDLSKRENPLSTVSGKYGKVVLDLGKLSAVLALPVGLTLLVSYLRDESAPLPLTDTSITILLYLVSVAFLFITFVVVSVFLLPVYRRIMPGTKSAKEGAASEREPPFVLLRRRIRQYVPEFGHFHVALLALVILAINHPWIALAVLVLGEGLWIWLGLLPKLRKESARKGRQAEIISEAFMDFAVSFASFMVLFALGTFFVRQSGVKGHDGLLSLLLVGSPLLVHAFIFVMVTSWKGALVIYFQVIVIMFMIWPGMPFLGGGALSLLGIGGNVPVSITIKTYGRTGTVSGTETAMGCMVIMTGADVILRPTNRRSDCALRPRLVWFKVDEQPVVFYKQVERFSRVDVIRISEFPGTCDTVDGLPDPRCSGAEKPAESATGSTK